MQAKFKRLAGILVLAMSAPAAVNASTVVLYDNTSIATPINGGFASVTTNGDGFWGSNKFSTGTACGSLGCTLGNITLRLATTGVNEDITTGLNDFSNFHLSIHSDNAGTTGTALTGLGDISNPTGAIEAGSPPGSIIGTTPSKHYEFQPTAAGSITLAENTDYWVKLTGTISSDPYLKWDALQEPGGIGFYIGGTTYHLPQYSLVMKVEATPNISAVPIPGAIWLMGSALVGFVGWGRRLQV